MLVRMNIAAGFAAAFSAIVGAVLTRYAQTLNTPPFGFGLIAAIPFLAALAQIPASYAVERFGGRKWVSVISLLIHRLLWLAVAAVPWVLPHAWWWLGLVVVIGLTNLSANIGTPGVTSWAADLVPARIRGRYYALRGQYVRIIMIASSLGLGWLMDRAQAHGTPVLLLTLSVLLALGALLGAVDLLLCFALPDRWHQPRGSALPFADIFRQPLADHNFRCFLGYSAFITFATGYIGPFVWLYLVDVVKESNSEAIFMTVVGTGLVSMLGMRFWGARVDRWGYKRVMLIAGLLVLNGASSWALVTPEHKWLGYCGVLVSALGWPAMELAGGNLLFSMAETGRNGGVRLGSAFAALNSAVVAVTGTLSGLFGGWVAEVLKSWHGIWFGRPVTFHVLLFVLSAVIRVFALLCILQMRDERARKAAPVAETAAG